LTGSRMAIVSGDQGNHGGPAMGRLWRSTTIFALTFFFGAADVLWAMSPQEAARGVLRRLLPARAAGFIIDVIPSDNGADVFEIESRDGKIVLRGSNGLAI